MRRSDPSVRFEVLTLPAPGFEAFTFPRHRPLLTNAEVDAPGPRLAVGAWRGEEPVGLALFSHPVGEERELFSIMVTHTLRRESIGTRLLAHAERAAFERGSKRLLAFHSTRLQSLTAFEQLLRRSGWASSLVRCRLAGESRWALQAREQWAPFLGRLRSRGFSTKSWRDLTSSDREQIAVVLERDVPQADRRFDPRLREDRPEALPELSLLLKRDDQVVGWLMASSGALSGVVHYSNGYVIPSLQKAGWLIAGVLEVCVLQAQIRGPESLSIFETSPDNHGMRRFMTRQTDRFVGWTDSRIRSEKSLTDVRAPSSSGA